MPDYKEMYFKLFNKLTDIEEEIKTMQQQIEDMYLSAEDESEENEG